jgi:type VI secretion system secreted protein VgrG
MPPRYSQENRTFRVNVPSLGGEDVLLLDGFTANSGVSEPFQLTLQLVSEDDAVDPAAVLREPFLVTIELPDDSVRHIHGFCNRFAQRGKSEELTSYEAEIVPWLWFLSLNHDCRIFQEMSVLEILEVVFGKYGQADYEIRCVESYSQKEYCVQYRESDLSFVSRLMEEEGIFYFFEHSEEGHKLILADDSSAIQECRGQERFRVTTTPDARPDEDIIEELEREHQVYTTQITLTDYDPLQPSLSLESFQSDGSHEELYDFPGKYEKLPDGERYALLRLQEQSAAQQTVRGQGRCRAFRSGYKFDLTEHYRADTNQGYLLLSVWESGYNGGYRSQAGEAEYSNNFQCVPADIQYRPSRKTPKPVVHGSQTAIVVGPSGEEIYTDSHGRVKVQFHWDRKGKLDENSSCWIRVSHPWAGKGWGAVSIPRIGQEVIVDFLEGDPDRPIITGRVYNAEAMPPYGLPDDGVVSGIKSATHKGSGYNEISMNDTAGKEKITIHAQYDMGTTVLHDKTTTVKNDDTQTVENNRTITVNGTHTETIKKDTKITITEGDHSTAVSAGKQSNTVSKEIEIKSETSSIKIEAATQIELKVGASTLLMKSDGSIKLEGVSVAIEGKAKVAIHGAMVSSEADATHNTKGAIVLSEGSATNTVKGGMVMLNP